MTRRMCAMKGILAGLLLAGFALTAEAEREAGTDLLHTERWRENKYGVSFRPPLGAKLVRQSGDEQLVRISGNDPAYEMTIDVKRSRRPMELAELVDSAKQQQRATHPDVKLLGGGEMKIDDLPAHRLSFRIPVPARKTNALLEQVLIQTDPLTVAVVEMRGRFDEATRLRRLLEAVLGTMEIADQAALAEARRAAVARTEKWRETLTKEQLEAAASGAAYFRIVEGERDIGWMEVERKTGTFNGEQGVAVVIVSHLRLSQGRIDSQGRYFRPFSGPVGETWTVKTTYRPSARGRAPRTAVETGTVTDDHIEIRLDANTGEKNETRRFSRRPIGYLPQADGWLLGQLLPHEAATTYGFYWYNRRDRKVTFRSDKVTPALDGFTITSRLSPNGPALRADYDGRGRLREKDLGGGRRILRSDAEELKRRWQNRP